MKRNILFGLTMLLAFPLSVAAQDEYDDEIVEFAPKKKVSASQNKYDTRTIKGRVINAATGQPISGAMVKAAGINGYSALTDDNGEYTVKVPVFASAVYVSTPDFNGITVGLSNDEMQRTAKLLPAVFAADDNGEVNNMGVQTASDFKYSPAANIKEEMQKQLGAYAYNTQRNGTPGVGNTMFIQGLNSLNVNAQPLVVVDGVIVDQQYNRGVLHDGFYNDILSNINPADIQSVNILRNGTALYGARGANGVVEINTKRSHSMATRITASVSAGVVLEPKYYDVMGAEQYRGYASEMLKTTKTTITDFKFLNANPNYYYYNQYHNNTDWKEQIYRTAMTQNYGINVEGGDPIAMYNLSVGYTSTESTLKYNDMQRLNVRFNTDIQLLEKLGVRFDASFSNITRDIRNDGAPEGFDEGTPTAPAFLAYVKSPFLSPYSYGNGQLSKNFLDVTDESYLDEALYRYNGYNYQLGNPYAINQYAEAENKNRFENSLLNIAITPKYDFRRNLSLSEHFSYTLINTNNKYYIPVNGVPTFYVNSVSAYRENLVSSMAGRSNSIQSDTRLAWNNRYGAHDVSAFGGFRFNIESYSYGRPLGYNTGSDKTPFLSGSLLNAQTSGVDEAWRNLDMYAQVNYNYKGRYYVQGNMTASASSRFGEHAAGGVKLLGVKWGIFPSVQASWVMTNEPWMANVRGINYLRLTAGFDISGNDDINVFARKSYFASSLFLNDIAALSFAGIGNTEIKWETTRRFNAGFELRTLNNRFNIAFNYFNSTTSDLLSLQQLSFLTGNKYNYANAGKLRNIGCDVTMSGKVLATKDWGLTIGASVGTYQNQIKELPNNNAAIITDFNGANILTSVGNPANLFYGYTTKGVYATTEQAKADGLYILDANGISHNEFGAGDVIFNDVNGDKAIDEKDMVVIGNPNPDIYGNIFTSLTFKRFKLDMNFNYSIGNDIYNYMRQQLEGGSRFMNQTTAMTRRWQYEGQVTDMPKISFQDPMGNSRFSDRWIEDGSYLKLKSVTLSYDLPINSTFLQGLQFWVQGNNLFTLTHYLGTDPEVSVTNSVIGQGIDYGRLGQSRSIVAGVKINL